LARGSAFGLVIVIYPSGFAALVQIIVGRLV
jgi:hypothetical protein